MNSRERKTRLTAGEKIALAVIVILIIIIILLIFNQEIKEYIEAFKNWYGIEI